jgi:predicted enzyme related to lactoylglutathione lyase
MAQHRTLMLGRRGLVVSASAIALMRPALAQTAARTPAAALPALVSPPTQTHLVGRLVFAQLISPDIGAAGAFYSALFGWTLQELRFGPTVYAIASLGGRPIAGMLQRPFPPGEQRQPAWLSFLSVSDVDAAATVATQQGAKTLFGPRTVPDLGREAILADPQGAVFAMLSSSSGDPPDEVPPVGDWIWSSLITSDPDRAAAFYQTVFGYEVFDLPGRAEVQHFLLASGGAARVSINPLPVDRPDARPRWLGYVRVLDAAAVAEKVVSLGGRVLMPPTVDRHGGRVAVMADPQRALFGLLEWADENGADSDQ